MNAHRALLSVMTLVFATCLTACGGGGGGSSSAGNGLIDVTDENALTDALVVRFGEKLGRTTEGGLPTKTNTGSEPVITPVVENRTAANGETVDLDLQIDSSSTLGSLLVKVVGADNFLTINLLDEQRSKVSVSETLEIAIPDNITDGTFCVQIVAVDDAERVSEAEQTCIDVESTADDAPSFTASFFNDRAFYMSGIEGTALFDGEFIALFQYTFRGNGTATETWSPSEENSFSTSDTYEVDWEVDSTGKLITTDTDEDGRYVLELTPSAIASDSANFSWTLTFFDTSGNAVASDAGTGGMTAANTGLYNFLAGRTFDVSVPDSDIETLVLNSDGTGSIRFAPKEDNDFDQNDINNLHWQASQSDRLLYTEFAGDGYDRDETNCEEDPNVGCSLNPANAALDFISIDANSASFDFEVNSDDGSFTGSGSMTAAADEQSGGGGDVLQKLQGSWFFACSGGESDDGTPESFSGSWLFSGTDLTVTESLYEGNTTCSGQASADSPFTEEFTISIGQETVADDGNPATELDIFEEGVLTDLCIVRVEQDRFLLGCEGQEPRATTFNEGEFVREG